MDNFFSSDFSFLMKRNQFYEIETVTTNTHPSQMKNRGQLQCSRVDQSVGLGKNSTGNITNQNFFLTV
jgi:hypothetical protein